MFARTGFPYLAASEHTAPISSKLCRASQKTMSAPALQNASILHSVSSIDTAWRESVLAMMTILSRSLCVSSRASTAARSFARATALETTSLFWTWPQLFGTTWSGESDWAPPQRLLSEGTSALVRYSYALYWAVSLSSQINMPMPDTVPQVIFSLFVP